MSIGITAASRETVEHNKSVVLSLLENNDAQNFDHILKITTSDFVGHHQYVPEGIHGDQGLREFFFLTEGVSFSGGVHTIHHLYGEGDMVTVDFTFDAMFVAALPNGIPPTGKKFTTRFSCNCRLVEGKIAEIWWFEFDSDGAKKLLGIL